jgi:hypothetical protein
METLTALAKALDMPVRDLFPEDAVDRSLSPARQRKEADATALIRALPDHVLDIAIDQLKALGQIGKKSS